MGQRSDVAMASKLSRSLHLPRRSKTAALGWAPHRLGRWTGPALPPPCQEMTGAKEAAGKAGRWQRRAVREALLSALYTGLLTSAVLASPEMFRQSPVATWRQLTIPALAAANLPAKGVLLDCP
jgi:hypothetical protein